MSAPTSSSHAANTLPTASGASIFRRRRRCDIAASRVTGSSFGGVKGRTQVPLLVDHWLNGDIDVEALLSHRISLDEVNRGFELMEAQDGIRSVITFG